MRETKVEKRLKRLEDYGFLVLKLTCPAYNGVMDRMILAPTWSPAPPIFVEVKAPDKEPRKLQVQVAINWCDRGVDVREYVDTIEKADTLVGDIFWQAMNRIPAYDRVHLPIHIREEYHRIFNERNKQWLNNA